MSKPAADAPKTTATTQIINDLAALTAQVQELRTAFDSYVKESRTRHVQITEQNNETQAKVASLAAGRKTNNRTTTEAKEAAATNGSPKGVKTYANTMGYFTGEYVKSENRERFRGYLTDAVATAVDTHMKSSKKKDGSEARYKEEATYIWKTYIAKKKDDSAEVEASKVAIREQVAADYEKYKEPVAGAESTSGEKE